MQGKKKNCSTTFPLIEGFRATTYFKAFILNAIAVAIIAALSIEMRSYLDRQSLKVKGGWNLSDATKTTIVFVSGFTIAMIVYVTMYTIVGFGGGMLTDNTL